MSEYIRGLRMAQDVVLDLETRWRNSASELRKQGTVNVRGWLGYKRTYVTWRYEKAAKDFEGAAHGLETIRKCLDMIIEREHLRCSIDCSDTGSDATRSS